MEEKTVLQASEVTVGDTTYAIRIAYIAWGSGNGNTTAVKITI